MAGTMGKYQYISDDGNTYKVSLDDSNSLAVGSTPAVGTESALPHGYYPRYVLAQSGAGRRRKVVVCDPANAHWTGAAGGEAVNLEEVNSAAPISFTITARIGEKRTSR